MALEREERVSSQKPTIGMADGVECSTKSRSQGMRRCNLRSWWRVLLLIVLAVSLGGAQEIGVDLCACSPSVFQFTFDFGLTCPPINIDKGPGTGINQTTCVIQAFGNTSTTDLVPVSVSRVTVLELGPSLAILDQETVVGDFQNGDTFEYTSIAAVADNVQDPSTLPRGLQLIITGENDDGFTIINFWLMTYTNNCEVEPILDVGESAGWTVFSDLTPPRAELCPAASETPTAVPAPTTDSPTTGPPTTGPPTTGPPTTGPPTTDPPSTGPPTTGPPTTGPPSTGPPTTGPPTTGQPTTPPPVITFVPTQDQPTTPAPAGPTPPPAGPTPTPPPSGPTPTPPPAGPTPTPPPAGPTPTPPPAGPTPTPPPAGPTPTPPPAGPGPDPTPAPAGPGPDPTPAPAGPTPPTPDFSMSFDYSYSMSMSMSYSTGRSLEEAIEDWSIEFGRAVEPGSSGLRVNKPRRTNEQEFKRLRL